MGECDIKSYVINLEERIHRWYKFRDLDIGIERINAVDTRKDTESHLSRFNLCVSPADKLSKLYFKNSNGAVGCYLSHYVFWKKLVDDNLSKAIVFEDDILDVDVKALLCNKSKFDLLDSKEPRLIQFNKRTTVDKLPYWFDGTESYAINKAAAEALINLTHDFSDMQGHKIEYAWDVKDTNVTKKMLYDMWREHDLGIDYVKKDTIRYAADKFIGYCSLSNIKLENRLKIFIDPQIALVNNEIASDVICKENFWWTKNLNEIKKITRDL